MTEKRTPEHDLEAIKLAFSDGSGHVTGVATKDAASLGCDLAEITTIIQTMVAAHFSNL
jgi:hypothetical protein